ncbi:DUF4168 domain-containing protein [Ectothiorhodospiraceae bacterium 2226]|nr:DUF4168 domain-containing protein [Ectothiorhodospiraceae bacterium 2226]
MPTRTTLTGSFAAAALAAAMAFTLPAMAQEGGYGQPDGAQGQPMPPAAQPEPQLQAEDLDDEQLEAFAAAFVEVDKIRAQYEPELERSEDPQQAMEIQRQANEEMIQAIENEGLDPQTYNAIAMAAGPDEQLRNRLLDMIEEKQQN